MSSSLQGKNIILGITGGIAAYKSAMLLRLLVRAGAQVQVIATPAALEFITPVTLSALSHRPVISRFFTANTGEWNSHVDLGLWADAMVIAPATACTMAKMATGVADNMLVTSYLSARCPVWAAPAMDFDMMRHPTTCRNIATLRADGVHIIEPEAGELASGLVGKGRMAEPQQIAEELEKYFAGNGALKGKRVLITAGPTYERIDPVRFIGNFSTGKMGFALADAAAEAGADVTVVAGPTVVRPERADVKIIDVESARQMMQACQDVFDNVDIAIFCAAVADYAPENFTDAKIKREHVDTLNLALRRNPDIAATLAADAKPGQYLVGFALETAAADESEALARAKMEAKHMDMLVLNTLADKGAGIATDTNKVKIFTADTETDIALKPKKDVARDIIAAIAANINK